MCRLFQLSDKEPDVRFFHFLFWKLLTKHNFNKVFPVPQFTFNHNNLSYNYGYSTETIYRGEANLFDCCDYYLRGKAYVNTMAL